MGMTPDYEYKGKCNIRFFNCDNMEFMKEVEDKQYSLSITDPPYGINASKGAWGSSNKGKVTNYGKKDWDKQTPEQDYFLELRRVSKNQIVWGSNHFISRMPFDSSCWLVWDKQNTGDFADCELAWTSFDTAVRKFTYRWNGMLQQDMKNKEERIHPTQKPIALYRWLLQKYAKQGDKILDTHGGSMTLARACYEEGFDLDIMELDKEYFDKGVLAFKQHVSQQKLF